MNDQSYNCDEPESDNCGIDDDDLPLFNLVEKMQERKNNDMPMVEARISSNKQQKCTDTADHREEENRISSIPLMSHSEGLAALETALCYIEQQPEATPADIMLLRRWCEIAARKRSNMFKQKTLDNHFNAQSIQ